LETRTLRKLDESLYWRWKCKKVKRAYRISSIKEKAKRNGIRA
jgi:hypothetical protein